MGSTSGSADTTLATLSDDDDSSLSDCDDNINLKYFVCKLPKCGGKYSHQKYICKHCGYCSGLHIMSGNAIKTENPLHCRCLSKGVCGYYGGRKASGRPCDARGKGRCARHSSAGSKHKKKRQRSQPNTTVYNLHPDGYAECTIMMRDVSTGRTMPVRVRMPSFRPVPVGVRRAQAELPHSDLSWG